MVWRTIGTVGEGCESLLEDVWLVKASVARGVKRNSFSFRICCFESQSVAYDVQIVLAAKFLVS